MVDAIEPAAASPQPPSAPRLEVEAGSAELDFEPDAGSSAPPPESDRGRSVDVQA